MATEAGTPGISGNDIPTNDVKRYLLIFDEKDPPIESIDVNDAVERAEIGLSWDCMRLTKFGETLHLVIMEPQSTRPRRGVDFVKIEIEYTKNLPRTAGRPNHLYIPFYCRDMFGFQLDPRKVRKVKNFAPEPDIGNEFWQQQNEV